ncbi:hypothetical protein NQ318_014124 [Aromia moschata]|uniref:ZAD domain-containing protein n=1 Tax=Aromia moschata TaxID=1265417 RepID=A0AAV8XM62_9CUCU|nr:hypothetical protein NQ318_014124 [Aromia moschata]
MTELRVCQLCFKASRDFQVIDENSREMLDGLLLKIEYSLNEDYVICESCADSIKTFFKFKSICLYTHDHMTPFIKSTTGMDVDIEEMKENSGTDTISNSDDAICRLCLKRDRCVDLNILNKNFDEDITAKCMPELDINFSSDPKICLSCQTTLINYYQFMTKCLVKQEDTMEHDDRDACLAIKLEEFDIKTEEEDCDRLRCV